MNCHFLLISIHNFHFLSPIHKSYRLLVLILVGPRAIDYMYTIFSSVLNWTELNCILYIVLPNTTELWIANKRDPTSYNFINNPSPYFTIKHYHPPREYRMIYRWPGFLCRSMIWLLFHPSISRQQVASLSQSSWVLLVELTDGKGGEEA